MDALIARMQPYATYRFVRHHAVEDWLRLGWMPTPILDGTHHGEWSVALAWPCRCPMAVPR